MSVIGIDGKRAPESTDLLFAWEGETQESVVQHDAWLLSFVDLLSLLLALFVLLLAWQNRPVGGDNPPDHLLNKPRATAPAAHKPAMPIPSTVSPAMSSVPSAGGTDQPLATNLAPVLMPRARFVDLPPVPRLAPVATTTKPRPTTLNPRTGKTPANPGENAPASAPLRETIVAESGADHPLQAGETKVEPDAVKTLLDTLATPGLAQRVQVRQNPDALRLDLAERILFAPGSAVLTHEGRSLLHELARALQTLPWSVAVEGHTDNRPIHTTRFPSNWELSTARATRVARLLIAAGIAQERIRAIGYAHTRPLASNGTARGRALNRRVSLVLELPHPRSPEQNPANL
ncbi:MAG TPA: hypothetical protein ENJ79_00960 [Gammaproteobacteria bacterium]|nr:hypothetical protein [Gammaproteobacteria bacterium]